MDFILDLLKDLGRKEGYNTQHRERLLIIVCKYTPGKISFKLSQKIGENKIFTFSVEKEKAENDFSYDEYSIGQDLAFALTKLLINCVHEEIQPSRFPGKEKC